MNEIKKETLTIGIGKDFKARFKAKCYENGETIKDVVLRAIEEYLGEI